jgi:hypothetical protein
MIDKMCAKCHIELHCKQNGVYVMEYAGQLPYKLWEADLWDCPGCGAEIVVGFGSKPLAEHYQMAFGAYVASIRKNGHEIINCYERLPEVIKP